MASQRFNPFDRLRSPAGDRPAAGAKPDDAEEIMVIGLGRFGSALARTLVQMGHEVLGVDLDESTVQHHAAELTHVVAADATNPATLEQLGAADFPTAVVGIGGDIEASILTTAALVDIGVERIWAKAITAAHGRILERVGARHVVYPEHEMGERVAHLVTGRMLDYIGLDDDYALVQTRPPRDMVGHTVGDLALRSRHGVTVVCIKPAGQSFTHATAGTVLQEGDLLLVAGEPRQVDRFADLT